jgi:biotin transporter BioY
MNESPELPEPPRVGRSVAAKVTSPVENRSGAGAAGTPAEKWDELDPGFVGRTYRSSVVIVGFTCLYLAARGIGWAVLPVFCGAALSVGVFWLNEAGFRLLFAPHGGAVAGKDGETKKFARANRLRQISWVALVKYLLVGALVAVAVRFWDVARIAAFAGGFCLVHAGIVLRVISRLLLARMNDTSK